MEHSSLMLNNVSFRFSAHSPDFFKNLQARFPAHTLNIIYGQNGAGKSTLFKIISGAIEPTQQVTGTLVLHDQSYSITNDEKQNQAFAPYIGLVQQVSATMLAPSFTVKQNLQCAKLPKFPGLRSLQSVADVQVFEKLRPFMDKPVEQLSGGQQQLLAITMVLQNNPAVLLLDEPTAALDPKNAQMVLAFLQTIAAKTSTIIIIISHDRALAELYKKDAYKLYEDEETGMRMLAKV